MLILPTASTADVTFMQQHTKTSTKSLKPRLVQTKQVHFVAGPVNTVAPAVTGTLAVGQVQTCSTGTWLNSPTFTYQWRRKKTNIAGATAATYTLTATDSGYNLECVVTGTNGQGAVSALSNVISAP